MHKEFSSVILTEAIDTLEHVEMKPGDVGVICDITGDHLEYALEFFGLNGWTVSLGWATPSQVRAVTPKDLMHVRYDKNAISHRPSPEVEAIRVEEEIDRERGGPRVVLTEPVNTESGMLMQPGDVGILKQTIPNDEAHIIAFLDVNHDVVDVGKAKLNQIRPVTPHDLPHSRVMKESPAKVG